jgi:hypothetical protein
VSGHVEPRAAPDYRLRVMQQPPGSGYPPPPGQGWQPQPQPGWGGPPASGPVRRPGSVTAAGVLLIVAGSLAALIGVLFVIAGAVVNNSNFGPFDNVGAVVIVIGVLVLVYAVFEIISGAKVMALRNGWRIAGIVFAAIGVVFSFFSVIGSFSSENRLTVDSAGNLVARHGANPGGIVVGVIFLAMYLFTLVVLARNGRYFQRPAPVQQWPPPQQQQPGQFTG